MNKFSMNVCPLCDKVTKFHKVNGVPAFECRDGHYQVELESESTIQHIFIDNLCLDNYSNHDKSRIFRLEDNQWNLVGEVAPIHASDEAAIRSRLNKLFPQYA
jgi:hypothetical protein